MKAQERRTGDLPTANSPTRTTDTVWKPFSAHIRATLATECCLSYSSVLAIPFCTAKSEPGTCCWSHTAWRILLPESVRPTYKIKFSPSHKRKNPTLKTDLLERLLPYMHVQGRQPARRRAPGAFSRTPHLFFPTTRKIHKHSSKSKLLSLTLNSKEMLTEGILITK